MPKSFPRHALYVFKTHLKHFEPFTTYIQKHIHKTHQMFLKLLKHIYNKSMSETYIDKCRTKAPKTYKNIKIVDRDEYLIRI